jgi:hypothetical protein
MVPKGQAGLAGPESELHHPRQTFAGATGKGLQ